jgi:hypothetical protein
MKVAILRKKFIILTLATLTALLVGCTKTPDDSEKIQRVENIVCGERFTMNGDDVSSLDRDLHFSAYWSENRSDVALGVSVKNGTFSFYTDYDSAVHGFWNEEYHKAIDRLHFDSVDYGSATGNFCQPDVVYIYMDENASQKDKDKVEALCKDLRKICVMEDAYHTSSTVFRYAVHVYYTTKDSDECRQLERIRITSDATDDELKLDNHSLTGVVNHEKIHTPLANGNALIVIDEE